MTTDLSPVVRFEDLLGEFSDIDGVTLPHGGSGFGRSALRYRGKIFAMFVRGALVVKLPGQRVDELITAGHGARFGLPHGSSDTGYGHNRVQVAAVSDACAASALLADYHEAVYEQTVKLVSGITDADLDRVVDRSWRPPVTLAVRLVSVLNDDAQHAGQAAFVRGIVLRAG